MDEKAIADNRPENDPYANFRFRIKWDGRYVAGMNKLSLFTKCVGHQAGSIILHSPASRTPCTDHECVQVSLEQGVACDAEFEKWLSQAVEYSSLKKPEPCRNITIELYNEQGVVAQSYNIFGCRVSRYEILPEEGQDSLFVGIKRLIMQNDGWESMATHPAGVACRG